MSWLAIGVCLALSFVFSGTEAGLLSFNRIRLRHLARQRDPAALRLEQLLQQPTKLFVTVLFVTSLMNIIAVVLLAGRLVAFFGRFGYFWTLLIAVPVLLLVVEILPKSIFRRFPYRALASIALPLELASSILTPVIWVGTWFAQRVLHLQRPQEIFLAREDLKDVTSEIERMGALSSIERRMIHNVVDFQSVRVRDVMVKMETVVFVRPDSPLDDVVRLSKEAKFDRLPVIDETGKIVGVVNVFDLIVDRQPDAVAQRYLRRILTVTAGEPASLVIRRLRAVPQSLAAVVNDSGQTVGIVSVEDLLNPLVKV
jgi:CBS domain containing-hemolysin-like protein